MLTSKMLKWLVKDLSDGLKIEMSKNDKTGEVAWTAHFSRNTIHFRLGRAQKVRVDLGAVISDENHNLLFVHGVIVYY